MRPIIDLSGQRFGLLTVERLSDARVRGLAIWICRCICGNETTASTRRLRFRKHNSCGCDANRGPKRHVPEKTAWHHMIARCTRPSHPNYHQYGGRGVGVCERWKCFENFLADVGVRPSQELSLDRIDNARGYEPGNVRWADKKTQTRNRRNTKLDEITVSQIRWLCAEGGHRQAVVARAFEVSQMQISNIVRGKSWAL